MWRTPCNTHNPGDSRAPRLLARRASPLPRPPWFSLTQWSPPPKPNNKESHWAFCQYSGLPKCCRLISELFSVGRVFIAQTNFGLNCTNHSGVCGHSLLFSGITNPPSIFYSANQNHSHLFSFSGYLFKTVPRPMKCCILMTKKMMTGDWDLLLTCGELFVLTLQSKLCLLLGPHCCATRIFRWTWYWKQTSPLLEAPTQSNSLLSICLPSL